MGLLDGIVGNAVQSALGGGGQGKLQLVMQLVEQSGGLPGLLDKFKQGGFGEHVQSWIGTGANLPIDAATITKVLGNPTLTACAQKLGVDPQQAAQTLSSLLPQVVDKLTPKGEVPSDTSNLLKTGLSSLQSLLGK